MLSGLVFWNRWAYDRPVLRAALLLASASLVVAVPAASSDPWWPKPVTIRVYVTVVKQSLVEDVAPHTAVLGMLTKGDTTKGPALLRNVVPQFGKAKGWNVGTVSTVFVSLSPQTVKIDNISRFAGGTVHARGVSKIGRNFKLPIVGGTGIYAGATGVVESRYLYYTDVGAVWLNIYRLRLP